MKRVMLVIRHGFDANYICTHLPSDKYDFTIILEKGKTAKIKKLKRMFTTRKNPLYTLLDLLALYIYNFFEIGRMRSQCINSDEITNADFEHINILHLKNCMRIDDINAYSMNQIITKQHPDIIIIYGTGIVKNETLEIITNLGIEIFNIHSSVLPAYRNVHSDFWAYKYHDYDKIGISIIRLASGIDTGPIACQMVCDLSAGSRLYQYKAWNLIHIPVLMNEFLEDFFNDDISYISQNETQASIYPTPTFIDILSLIKRKI